MCSSRPVYVEPLVCFIPPLSLVLNCPSTQLCPFQTPSQLKDTSPGWRCSTCSSPSYHRTSDLVPPSTDQTTSSQRQRRKPQTTRSFLLTIPNRLQSISNQEWCSSHNTSLNIRLSRQLIWSTLRPISVGQSSPLHVRHLHLSKYRGIPKPGESGL